MMHQRPSINVTFLIYINCLYPLRAGTRLSHLHTLFSMYCAQSLGCIPLFVTPWTVAHQAPRSMGILQARILEWVAMLSSRGSSQPRDRTQVSHIAGRFFTI